MITKTGVKPGVETPTGQTTTTDYDMTGAVSRQVDERGVAATYVYTPVQRAVAVTTAGANGPRVQTAYADLLGRTVRVVDADQNEALTLYNDEHGIVTVRRTDGMEPTYPEPNASSVNGGSYAVGSSRASDTRPVRVPRAT